MSVTRTCRHCGFRRTYRTEALAAAHHPRHSCRRQARLAQAAQRRDARAAGTPKRDCIHSGHPHHHGTRTAYIKDCCHCRDCRAANAAARAAAVRAEIIGAPPSTVDASRTRAHINRLRAGQIGYGQIARLAGTSTTHIREIAHAVRRSGNRPPISKIRRELADRILGITPSPESRAPHSQIDGTGTCRRLQALTAIGHPPAELAGHLGLSPASLRRLMTRPTVTARTAKRVSDLYERLWDVPALHATAAQRGAAAAARRYAANRGWPPPLAWDDIDTDPEPDPTTPVNASDTNDIDEIAVDRAVAGDGIHLEDLTQAEQAEAVRRLTERGKSIRDIADQLGTTRRTVSRRRGSCRHADPRPRRSVAEAGCP